MIKVLNVLYAIISFTPIAHVILLVINHAYDNKVLQAIQSILFVLWCILVVVWFVLVIYKTIKNKREEK